jgi:hypothetical protein
MSDPLARYLVTRGLARHPARTFEGGATDPLLVGVGPGLHRLGDDGIITNVPAVTAQ